MEREVVEQVVVSLHSVTVLLPRVSVPLVLHLLQVDLIITGRPLQLLLGGELGWEEDYGELQIRGSYLQLEGEAEPIGEEGVGGVV